MALLDRLINAGTVAALIALSIHMARRNKMLRQQARQMKAISEVLLILYPHHDPEPPLARKVRAIDILTRANLR